jgi:hypothetical protein
MQSACAVLECHLLASSAVLHFSTFSHKRHEFRETLIFPQLSRETFLILRRIERDVAINVRIHVNCPLFLSDFKETWNFLDRFSKKKFKYQIS